jgi:predicted alpha/beta hydrolase family esterase
MQNYTVVFSHGRESGPWGTKIRVLARIAEQKGCYVISRDDTDTRDPEVRVERLIEEVSSLEGPVILVGSSMGGYVAAVAAQNVQPSGLFLMAPALEMPGYAVKKLSLDVDEITVVHGWGDDVVPLEPVQRFAQEHQAMLHVVPAAHALTEQIDVLGQLFDSFLKRSIAQSPESTQARVLATF